MPSVAYTDPEIAWVGLGGDEAKAKGIAYKKGAFPWVASGRSLSLGREDGLTKVLFDPETHRVLGGGIVGTNAGDLITEIALAIEMGATPQTSASRSIRIRRCRRRSRSRPKPSRGRSRILYIPRK